MLDPEFNDINKARQSHFVIGDYFAEVENYSLFERFSCGAINADNDAWTLPRDFHVNDVKAVLKDQSKIICHRDYTAGKFTMIHHPLGHVVSQFFHIALKELGTDLTWRDGGASMAITTKDLSEYLIKQYNDSRAKQLADGLLRDNQLPAGYDIYCKDLLIIALEAHLASPGEKPSKSAAKGPRDSVVAGPSTG